MSIRQFIRENREMIDLFIRDKGGRQFNDTEREEWILNNERLYMWARSQGVRI